jgi:hypothetical protein
VEGPETDPHQSTKGASVKFYPWVTDYENYCRQVGKIEERMFFVQRLSELRRYGMAPYRLVMEHNWFQDGKPYYNVHPRLVSKLVRVNLEKVPSHLIVTPEPFVTVHVALSEDHPEFTLQETLHCDNQQAWAQAVPSGACLQGILMTDMKRAPGQGQDQLCFCLDFGVRTRDGHASYIVFAIERDCTRSLAEAIDDTLKDGRSESYKEVCKNALRLAVTIGFMANSRADLIEPDVLSKLRAAYADACRRGDDGRKQSIENKSRRKGKVGFNVGNDLMFLGARPVRSGSGGGGEGRELQWQHLRDGHPRAVRYGEGKRLVKIMWIQPTQVRPDLPFKPEDKR